MEKRYFLCSELVSDLFPDHNKSKPFKSGYENDSENYFVIEINDYDFFIKSIPKEDNYWCRECCDSFVSKAPKFIAIDCRTIGVFKSVEKHWGLTKETNIAYCIFKMASRYKCNPVEFIDRVAN